MEEKKYSVPLLLKNSLWNLVGGGLPLIIGAMFIPIAIKGLGKDIFGILTIAWVVLGYFGLFDFGLSQATIKFSSEAIAKNDLTKFCHIFWTSLIVNFGLGIIIAIFFLLSTSFLVEHLLKIPSGLVEEAKFSLNILAVSLPSILCSSSLIGVLCSVRRFDIVNKIQIPVSISIYIIPGLSYILNLGFVKIIYLLIICRITACIIYLYFNIKLFTELKRNIRVDIEVLKTMLSFGGWVSITNIISPLLVYMDRFIIGSFISTTALTFYVAPYEIITRLRIFSNAIASTVFPEFSAALSNTNTEMIEILFVRNIKYILIVIGILIILLFFNAPSILEIWLGQEFIKESLDIFRILSIGVLLNSLAVVPFVLLQGIGRPDIPAKFHALEFAFYVILLLFLVKNYGIRGAALAWSIRVGIDSLLLIGFVIKKYPRVISYFKEYRLGRILILLLFSCLFLMLANFILPSVTAKIVYIPILIFLNLFTVWCFILDDFERQTIKLFYKNIILKK
jgi:O-antigen/teichoic acid export membrane protein